MNETEKKLIKDLFQYFEFLYNKTKEHDDIIKRVLEKKPGLISEEMKRKIEDKSQIISEKELTDIKNRISKL